MPRRSASRPSETILSRLAACRVKIQQKSVDGYLITSRVDQYYLTGFDGEDGATLVLPGHVYLFTDGRFLEEAAAVPWARTVIRKQGLTAEIARVLRRHRVGRLGFQPEVMTVQTHAAMRKALRPAKLVALPHLASGLRMRKDPTEVACIEKAIHVAQDAYRATLRRLRIGWTEKALAACLQHEMIRRGAEAPSFPIIVAEGSNAARPHAVPGDRKIRRGSAVLIDWGATVAHYRSDLTRVVFIRKIPPRFRRMYEQVLAAQEAGIAAIGPGVRMCDVDGAARRRLRKAGMDKAFSHSLGHGLGMDIHEAPRLARQAKENLEPGMVVTVEPGVYYAGIGGVRIEDVVLVTDTGHRVLSSLPKDLDSAVI